MPAENRGVMGIQPSQPSAQPLGSRVFGMPLISPVIRVRYERGVYLPNEEIWLDPWEAKPFAFVSHAHSDHIAPHDEIIVSERTARLMQARLPGKRNEHVLAFGQPATVRGLGSRFCRPVTSLVRPNFFSRLTPALFFTPAISNCGLADPPKRRNGSQADTLIMETTYGLPRYRLPPTELVVRQIVAFCREALEEGATPVLLGYSLGKAQEILCSLAEANLHPMLHGSVYRMTRIYEQFGQSFCEYERYTPARSRAKCSSARRARTVHACSKESSRNASR